MKKKMIELTKINESLLRIKAEDSTIAEMKDAFSYYVPNYQYTPQFRNGWNGKKCAFNVLKRTLYIGLLPDVAQWFDKMNYPYKVTGHFNCQEFSRVEALEFIESLNLPEKFKIREYQLKYFIKSVRNQRIINLSPTSSGKSIIIYLLFRYFNRKTLLVVPTIGLVTQMFEDFKEYGYDSETYAHKVYGGQEKKGLKVKFTIENGRLFIFDGNENIKLINNSKKFKKAEDVLETDEIDDRWLQEQNREQIL